MSAPRLALVGAGPGDPDLLTLRAEALLATAAVVVSDAAVEGLARRFGPAADVVVVPDGAPAVAVLLAAIAEAGGDVVRLYAGDPWLHPAHATELAALDRAGIASEPVAGVTIELAALATAGIAVHLRHLAVACTIAGLDDLPVTLDPARTLVIPTLDGAAAASAVAARGADHAAAVVPLADPASVVRGTLAELAVGVVPSGPGLLVIGAVTMATGDLLGPPASGRETPTEGGRRVAADGGSAPGPAVVGYQRDLDVRAEPVAPVGETRRPGPRRASGPGRLLPLGGLRVAVGGWVRS